MIQVTPEIIYRSSGTRLGPFVHGLTQAVSLHTGNKGLFQQTV